MACIYSFNCCCRVSCILEILQNRIDQFGVAEPTIQKQGKYRILVELAGVQDSDRARALLQSTALLEFYLVKNSAATNEIIVQLDNILKKAVSSCLLYTSPSPRDGLLSRMPSSA